jgi:signal peptidase I
VNPKVPPTLPRPQRKSLSRRRKLIIGLALIPAFLFGALILLRIFGLIRPFSIPTVGMAPAISVGDHVMMEDMTFLVRKPRHGDIVVFRTDGISSLPPAQFYVKRVAGEPGDHLRISQGMLFINDKRVVLSNAVGEIVYDLPPLAGAFPPNTEVTVPEGCYFVLGDNSTNSLDSRFLGSVPRQNIIGRIAFCYWPPQKLGRVR